MTKKAHAPYSKYNVGAAIKVDEGEIIGGCNIENASYPLSICAERTALFRAIAQGYKNFVSMAIATETGGTPCGSCRQVIWDICKNIEIHICNREGWLKTISSSELLPDAFDENFLK